MPDVPGQLEIVERVYLAMAAGRVELPPKPGIHPRENAFLHAMPAYLRDEDVAALKWVAGYPSNTQRGLPYISGLIVVNDPETGLPLAVLEAAEITASRTAAASGVCVRHFAPRGWRTAAILGCGEQGRYHARVLAEVNPEVVIKAYDPDPDAVARIPGRVEPATSARAAVDGVEVVVSAGPIVEHPSPELGSEWLGERYLLLPIDFDFYLRPDAVEAADLFVVDDVEQFDYYRAEGHFQGWPEPHGNVGEALAQRVAEQDRIVCCNLGVGALDAAFAKRVLDVAAHHGTGTWLPL